MDAYEPSGLVALGCWLALVISYLASLIRKF